MYVAKHHLKGRSSLKSVGKYSAVWLRRSNPREYSVCYLQMLTIKIKVCVVGFFVFSLLYFICVSTAESTLLNVSSLFLYTCQYNSSACSFYKNKIILSGVCQGTGLCTAEARKRLERTRMGKSGSHNYCLLSELGRRFSTSLENASLMNWKYYTWNVWGLIIFKSKGRQQSQSKWEHQFCLGLWLWCHGL